jgi:hypothetical protein
VKRSAVPVLLALVCATGAAAGSAVAPVPAKLVLRASQVGPNYVLIPFQGTQSLGQPTLAMCHMAFKSEALRKARDEVTFQRAKSDPTTSNEVVLYKPGGAAKAMSEVRAGIKRCPKGPVSAGGASLTTTITVLQPKGHFLPGFVALGLHESGTVNGKPATLDGTVLYQSKGDVLSGVYAYSSSAALRLQVLLHAGAQSALNLQR